MAYFIYYTKTLLALFTGSGLLKFLSAIFVTFLAYFSPIAPLAHLFMFIICLDFITGIIASHKRKETIESSKMKASIYKIVLYSLFILLCYTIENVVFANLIPLTKILTSVIILTEFKSLTENLDDIFQVQIFHQIYNKLKNLFNKNNQE